jgi:hypothetical protein
VLTLACARARREWWGSAVAGATFALSFLISPATLQPAHAQDHVQARAQEAVQEIESGSCVGDWRIFNCVNQWGPAGDAFIRTVPAPADQAERTIANERERRWVERCRPFLVQDRYGVLRYQYTKPGCAFDILGN